MDLNNFLDMVRDNMQFEIGDEARVEIKEVTKNNGKIYHGITIMGPESNCAPSVYLDEMFEEYKKGVSIESIMERLREIYDDSKCDMDVDVSFFTDYNKVCDKVMFKLIGYDKNEEMLKDMPHRRLLDMAVIYYCEVSDPKIGNGFITVRNEHAKCWEVDEERLYQDALKNTPRQNRVTVAALVDAVVEMTGVPDYDVNDDLDILVVSNTKKIFGAATILYPDVLQDISNSLECNLFIIPSSIHEVIVLPGRSGAGSKEARKLKEMVECVNQEAVADEDILSDNLYFYDRREGRCKLALS